MELRVVGYVPAKETFSMIEYSGLVGSIFKTLVNAFGHLSVLLELFNIGVLRKSFDDVVQFINSFIEIALFYNHSLLEFLLPLF